MDKKMNESLDLRNRILKMRENNNLIATNSSLSNNNLMSKFESSIKEDNSKKTDLIKSDNKDKNNEINSNLLKNNIENKFFQKDKPKNKTSKSSSDDNQAQFLMLANKFNEAVEVILELSEKVENLERLNKAKSNKTKDKSFFWLTFNIKIFAFIVIIPIIVLSFFTLPVDFDSIKSIILDIITTM